MSHLPGVRGNGVVRRRRRAGFTLLEVLVVVGIVALLVAILMPSIISARRQAQRVACQSQARQLVTAWHQLLDADQGRLPYTPTMSVDYGGKQGLANQYKQPKPLNKYLSLSEIAYSGADVFRCPSDREGLVSTKSYGYGVDARRTCFDYYGTSYKANRILVGSDRLVSPLDPCGSILRKLQDRKEGLNRSRFYDESRLILLGDFGWEDAWNIASSTRIEWHGRPGWHNIGFMDGHAEFTPIYKGIYVDDRYTVLPFKSLQREAVRLQPRH